MKTIPAGRRNCYMSAWNDSNEAGAPDAAGQIQPTAQKVCDFWGAIITPASGSREAWAGFRMQGDHAFVLRMPYVAGLTSRSWFTFGSRRFNAAGPPVNIEQRNRELAIPINDAGAI